MFTDHITIEWELIQGPTKLETGKTRDTFLWAANIVQVILVHTIELWEQWN